ncbi:MAG: hypothetical protein ACOCV4_07215 [Myxococcota bacterium]
MTRRKMLGVAVLASSIGWMGCGDDNGGGGGGDGPIALEKGDTGMAANYACEPTAPDAGGEVAFTLEVRDFEMGFPVIGACVNFYGDNVVPMNDTCGETFTDADGNIEVVDPDGGWYGYRIFEGENADEGQEWVGTVQTNEEAPGDGGSATGNSVSQNTIGLIPVVLGLTQDPEDAVVSGTVQDCDGDPIAGAAVRVVRGGEVIPPMSGAADAHYEYFNGDEFPQQGRSATNTDGLYIGVNIPIDTEGEEVLVVSCGQEEGLLGCESIRAFRNTVNIINVGPERSDGPAGCADLTDSICDGAFD